MMELIPTLQLYCLGLGVFFGAIAALEAWRRG